MKKFGLTLLIAVCCAALSPHAQAATQQEMEQARTIAAKWYLRYANNMSAYLDDINPKTMAELESQLKDTEKKNIGAFKAISVPSDYSSWDKDQLIAYWSGTFFKSPGLDKKGADCYNKVKSELKEISVTANAPAEPAAAATQPAQGAQAQTPAAPGDAADAALPDAGVEESAEPAQTKGKSNTWTYIVLLGILIIVVIGLIIYASNAMRRNNARNEPVRRREPRKEEDLPDARPARQPEQRATPRREERAAAQPAPRQERRESFAPRNVADTQRLEREIADRDAEIRRLSSDLRMAKGDLRHAETRLEETTRKLDEAREENTRLLAELERLGGATPRASHASFHQQAEVYGPGEAPRAAKREEPLPEAMPQATPRRTAAVADKPRTMEDPSLRKPAREAAPEPEEPREPSAPREHKYMPGTSKPAAERTIFLGRVNSKGIFVRADRNFNPGNSYYRLVTSDGASGTFSVINDPSVWEPALVAPDDVLFNACTGPKLNETYGRNEIITEEAGTAIFKDGAWHVTRKAKIRYL